VLDKPIDCNASPPLYRRKIMNEQMKQLLKKHPELAKKIEEGNPIITRSIERRVLSQIQDVVKNLNLEEKNEHTTK
jgi:hypothetical protein